jgi:hypothetical protein
MMSMPFMQPKRHLSVRYIAFQLAYPVADAGGCLEFLALDLELQFSLEPFNLALILDTSSRPYRHLAHVNDITMHSLEQWVETIGEVFIAGTAAETADFAELRVRQSAIFASDRLSFIRTYGALATRVEIEQSRQQIMDRESVRASRD